jgi:arylsulfatase A-like enzyme
LFHIPLMVRLPGREEIGRRIAALTQPLDLLPTLFDFFQITPPDSHGCSLLPIICGKVEEIRSYACAGLRLENYVEWALRTPKWSFVLPVHPVVSEALSKPTLFVKPDDRWDVNDVVQHHWALADRFALVLKGFVEATKQLGPFRPPLLGDLENIRAGDKPTEVSSSSVV